MYEIDMCRKMGCVWKRNLNISTQLLCKVGEMYVFIYLVCVELWCNLLLNEVLGHFKNHGAATNNVKKLLT